MKTKAVTAYKAFNPDWTCLGFQYSVGETFTHEGPVSICKSGFHACENPLDVLSYYSICDSKFALVEQSGSIARHDVDSKTASSTITIKAELGLATFIRESVKWLIRVGSTEKYIQVASGDGSQLAASGTRSQLAASGDDSQLAASGDGSQLAASGDNSVVVSSGLRSRAKAGPGGCITLTWHDGQRYRVAVGYVGEGLAADTWYKLKDSGEFVEVEAFEP